MKKIILAASIVVTVAMSSFAAATWTTAVTPMQIRVENTDTTGSASVPVAVMTLPSNATYVFPMTNVNATAWLSLIQEAIQTGKTIQILTDSYHPYYQYYDMNRYFRDKYLYVRGIAINK